MNTVTYDDALYYIDRKAKNTFYEAQYYKEIKKLIKGCKTIEEVIEVLEQNISMEYVGTALSHIRMELLYDVLTIGSTVHCIEVATAYETYIYRCFGMQYYKPHGLNEEIAIALRIDTISKKITSGTYTVQVWNDLKWNSSEYRVLCKELAKKMYGDEKALKAEKWYI